jgi:hypothetical protein
MCKAPTRGLDTWKSCEAIFWSLSFLITISMTTNRLTSLEGHGKNSRQGWDLALSYGCDHMRMSWILIVIYSVSTSSDIALVFGWFHNMEIQGSYTYLDKSDAPKSTIWSIGLRSKLHITPGRLILSIATFFYHILSYDSKMMKKPILKIGRYWEQGTLVIWMSCSDIAVGVLKYIAVMLQTRAPRGAFGELLSGCGISLYNPSLISSRKITVLELRTFSYTILTVRYSVVQYLSRSFPWLAVS